MRALARFNKYVTNPIQRMWAPYLPYMAVIEHVGRKSGTSYRTPVMAFVEAANTATVTHRGKRHRLVDPKVLPLDSPDLPRAVQGINTSARSALHGRLAAD
ncbi:nitroreductase family deazaflavin-dependent oxidoreductase [Mycobacterium aquaticum]|nr:nitroreductase family deazaflavin-dependent oxidoreductase [Mycobacterium aquaticum]